MKITNRLKKIEQKLPKQEREYLVFHMNESSTGEIDLAVKKSIEKTGKEPQVMMIEIVGERKDSNIPY